MGDSRARPRHPGDAGVLPHYLHHRDPAALTFAQINEEKRASTPPNQPGSITAHKSKGLEFDQDCLASSLIFSNTRSWVTIWRKSLEQLDSGISLAYAAATRAFKRLHPNASLQAAIEKVETA